MQFTKLFSSILDSTIWQEPPTTKLAWITMLAMADRSGEVHASIPGLAKRTGISIQECEAALECLLSPDKYSRTKDCEGRRIEEIDGGWWLINHDKYRALLSKEERREYNRLKQAEYRAKKRERVNDVSMTVIDNVSNAHSTEAEAESRRSKNATSPSDESLAFADFFRETLPDSIKLPSNWKNSWADTYDKLKRIDGRSKAEIKRVCQWARADSFWGKNILSPAKLRKRDGNGILYFDVLLAAMKGSPASSLRDPNLPAPL